jgi:uncharacterized membrane protein required for colicin V production
MNLPLTRRQRLSQELIPPLLIAVLGTVGVIGLYLTRPGFRPLDLILLLLIVAFGALGYKQRIVRGIMTILVLYLATGAAATLYRPFAPYAGIIWRLLESIVSGQLLSQGAGAPSAENVDGDSLSLSFCLLTVIVWIVVEVLIRASFRDTRLPGLGVLDNLGGTLVYLLVGLVVASLLFNAIGYGRLRRVHDQALLRPRFNQVVYIHYAAQSFWFPKQPPPIYVYDLHLAP